MTDGRRPAKHPIEIRGGVVSIERLDQKIIPGVVSIERPGSAGLAEERQAKATKPPKPDLSDAYNDEVVRRVAELLEKDIDRLVSLVVQRVDLLFHAPERTRYSAYADVRHGNVRETYAIGSSAMNELMLGLFYDVCNKALTQSVINGANGVLRALARRGPELQVHVRTAKRGDEYYLDLGGKDWKAVQISSHGWRVVDQPPVRFRRGGAMVELPAPVRGGHIDMLRQFLNVKNEDSFIMVVAWLLSALRPVGPYPVLVINGEQGSAKSSMAKILRSLVDPSTAPLRHASASDRDLFITAMHSWVLAFDNCSSIPGWLSDALCRLATGGGFATRALYTDVDEVVFNSKRPIILNGITEFVERGDLADRSLFVHLTPISKAERRTEREVLGEFEKVRPMILGALLDAMVEGLRRLPTITLPSKPRMAEFGEWAEACSPHFTEGGAFLEAYERNQAVAVSGVIEADPVATAIQEFAYRRHENRKGDWEGNATELMGELEMVVGEKATKQRSWPKSPQGMGGKVARLAPALRQTGIHIERPQRGNTKRKIIIGAAERPKDPQLVSSRAEGSAS